MNDLMIRNPSERTIAVLLRLADHRGGFRHCKPTREVDVSHESIAFMANLSRSMIVTDVVVLDVEIRHAEQRIVLLRGGAAAPYARASLFLCCADPTLPL